MRNNFHAKLKDCKFRNSNIRVINKIGSKDNLSNQKYFISFDLKVCFVPTMPIFLLFTTEVNHFLLKLFPKIS